MLSVAIDLSLQGALWSGSEPKVAGTQYPGPTAIVVPFALDAVRVTSPLSIAGPPVPIDGGSGATLGRIDGVPVSNATISGPGSLLFTQLASTARPFERPWHDPAALKGDHPSIPGTLDGGSFDVGQAGIPVPPKPFEKPVGEDFEFFKNVSFTYTGGQILAGLPIDGKIVNVKIIVSQLPKGASKLDGVLAGVGDFVARVASIRIVPPAGNGNGALALPDRLPPAPTVPPAGNPDQGTIPTPMPDRPGTQGPVGRPNVGGGRGEQGADGQPAVVPAFDRQTLASGQNATMRDAEFGAATTAVYADRHAFGDFQTGGLQFVTTTGPSGSVLSASAAGTTTILPELSAAQGDVGPVVRQIWFMAGTQLSALGRSAIEWFADGSDAGGSVAGPTIIDLDAIRNGSGAAVALGLTPWQMVTNPTEDTATAWKVTAGLSFVIAVSGYWYCKEYSARRRQEQQLLASRFVAGRRSSSSARTAGVLETETTAKQDASRPLVGRMSRLWRDEVVY